MARVGNLGKIATNVGRCSWMAPNAARQYPSVAGHPERPPSTWRNDSIVLSRHSSGRAGGRWTGITGAHSAEKRRRKKLTTGGTANLARKSLEYHLLERRVQNHPEAYDQRVDAPMDVVDRADCHHLVPGLISAIGVSRLSLSQYSISNGRPAELTILILPVNRKVSHAANLHQISHALRLVHRGGARGSTERE